MVPQQYYDEKEECARTLHEGDGMRNTHNFLKACLIEAHLPARAHLLDLGCGQGGDLLKYRRKKLKSYRGIDLSHTAIERNRERMSSIHFRCRSRLECADFCNKAWEAAETYDAISCQFALQYAFQTEEVAARVIGRIATSLKDGGVLLGTVPVHEDAPSYAQVVVRLPGDDRECREPSARHADISRICAQAGLEEVLFCPFDEYFAAMRAEHGDLARRMRALAPPDPQNAVFVYRRRPRNAS